MIFRVHVCGDVLIMFSTPKYLQFDLSSKSVVQTVIEIRTNQVESRLHICVNLLIVFSSPKYPQFDLSSKSVVPIILLVLLLVVFCISKFFILVLFWYCKSSKL